MDASRARAWAAVIFCLALAPVRCNESVVASPEIPEELERLATVHHVSRLVQPQIARELAELAVEDEDLAVSSESYAWYLPLQVSADLLSYVRRNVEPAVTALINRKYRLRESFGASLLGADEPSARAPEYAIVKYKEGGAAGTAMTMAPSTFSLALAIGPASAGGGTTIELLGGKRFPQGPGDALVFAGGALRHGARNVTRGEALFLVGHFFVESEVAKSSARWLRFEALRLSSRANPEDPTLHNLLGIAFEEQGQYGIAAMAFAEAMRLDGGTAAYVYNLSNAQRLAGDLAASESSLRAALALEPGHKGALMNLGGVLHLRARSGQLADAEAVFAAVDGARKAYGRCLELDPAHEGALDGLARLYADFPPAEDPRAGQGMGQGMGQGAGQGAAVGASGEL